MAWEVVSVWLTAASRTSPSVVATEKAIAALTHALPLFVPGMLVGAFVGVIVANGWGVRRRWVLAAAGALAGGYLLVWLGSVIAGFSR